MKRFVLTGGVAALLIFCLGPSTTNAATFTRYLDFGSSGADVSSLQQTLKAQGFFTYPQITGWFGPATQEALQQFQCAHNIICNGSPATTGYGRVGPATLDALGATSTATTTANVTINFTRDLTIGDTGTDVTALQQFLIADGYGISAGATGYFGSQTQTALAAYQTAQGINPPAGFFGPLTRAKLAVPITQESQPATTTPPQPPTSLKVNQQRSNQIVLSWSAVDGATSYTLKRRAYGDADYTIVASDLATTTYTDTSISSGKGYSYVVTASNAAGESGFSSVVGAIASSPGGGGGSPTPLPDTTAPTVSVTAPTDGATIYGSSVTISADASDNVGVSGVQFAVNGVNVGSEDTSSPYSITWDSTATSSGSKSIVAVARDAAGNYATSTSVTATVDNTAPVISSISSGTPSDTSATITWATDEAATSSVSFGLTTSYGTASSSAILTTSHSLTLTGLSAGTTYHYQIASADTQGNVATSSDQTFATSYQGLVATRLGVNTAIGTTYREANTRSAHYARQNITGLKLMLGNFYQPSGGTSELGTGATTTYYASVEYPAGTYNQVTFSGLASTTLTSKSVVTSDYIALSTPIPNGALFWVRMYMQSSAGILFQGYGSAVLGDGGEFTTTSTTNKTMIGGNVTGFSIFAQRPLAIIATTTQPSVLIVGDSLAVGTNETASSTSPDMGVVARWVGPTFAYSNVAQAGSNASQFNSSNTLLRRSLIPYITDVIYELGLNDIFGAGSSATTVTSAWQTNWGLATAQGKRAWQTTITPEPSATSDSWASAGGQTVNSTKNTVKNTLNNNLRGSLISGISGYFEVADSLENGRDSGLFITNGTASYYTADGIHGTAAAYSIVQAALTSVASSSIHWP